MASHHSREGGHHVWLVTRKRYCLVLLGKGLIFGLVAATRGKARPHSRGFSINTIFTIRLDGLARVETRMRRVGTLAWLELGEHGQRNLCMPKMRMFFSIPIDVDTRPLDVSICSLANG
ncbi:hypothetical protein VNO80_10182 [Phaseolus coccineus]|uniref:Uncharacterized protein n=1 Tax=Phaseolus coccineus TaxID=3886 RepID=A0AAN9N7N0_PHACN